MMSVVKKVISWPYKQTVAATVLALCAVLLALVLYSFNPHDLSWIFYSSSAGQVTNFFGSFGAQVAAFFFYAFGISSWGVVFFLGYFAYVLFFCIPFSRELDRMLALTILSVASSALFYCHAIQLFDGLAPGGVVGASTYYQLVGWFEPVGATIFLYVLFFICLITVFRVTFVRLLYVLAATVRFVLNREKFLRPAYTVIKKTAHAVTVPFVWTVQFVHRLFGGKDVIESGLPVVSFEEQLLYQVESSDVELDPFWQQFIGGDKQKEKLQAARVEHPVAEQQSDEQLSIAEHIVEKKSQCDAVLPDFAGVDPNENSKQTYQLPDRELFAKDDQEGDDIKAMTELEQRAKILEEKLERFGVYGSVVSIKRGPVVTLFEYHPQIDSKISKIIALEDDLALALQAMSIRIIAPIPGTSVVGFEVANIERKGVLLSSIIHSKSFEQFSGSLPLVLGQDTIGNEILVDLAKMPHLLIAGSTGSGKSVGLNAFLVSLLCKLTPDELKLILIDPKRLEFASYADIPHLLFPIIVEPKRTAPVLRWVVQQMEERYAKMSAVGARNIFDYNDYLFRARKKTRMVDDELPERLPFIVIVIDELSDLMMAAGRDIEGLIARIAQMARAAGIHMIVATQRPSVDVITGLIKVNFPSRISFRVTSKVDSRTILDCGGAEKLLGSGDMLFLDSRSSTLRRLHGGYVSNKEIETLVEHIRAQRSVEYLDLSSELTDENSDLSDADDALLKDVLSFLDAVDEVSISLLQRKFRIGYNRSARIIDMLESRGIIMPSEGSKMRKVIR